MVSSLDSNVLQAAKRQRVQAAVVQRLGGKDKTAEIQRLLAASVNAHAGIAIVMSWNIDGLDEVGGLEALTLRTLDVALAIAKARPVAVLLQECVHHSLKLLDDHSVLGASYDILVPRNPPMPYYVAILLDKKRTKVLAGPDTVDFSSTQMGRQLLSVIAVVDGQLEQPFVFATAHLESTKDHGEERKRQLKRSLESMRSSVQTASALGKSPCTPCCIFGGDLNLRDEEFTKVQLEMGDDSEGIVDVWSWCGSNEAERYTWDTTENTNLDCVYKYRSRFDRLFFLTPGISDEPGTKAKSKAKANGKGKAKAMVHLELEKKPGWRPTSFSLIGKHKVHGLNRFPSDHWGMLTEFCSGQRIGAEETGSD